MPTQWIIAESPEQIAVLAALFAASIAAFIVVIAWRLIRRR